MGQMGATEQQIQQQTDHMLPDDKCELLVENQPIVNWFIQVHNDGLFKYVNNVLVGLDILAIKADAQMSGNKILAEHYQGLKIMGREFCEAINTQRMATEE